MKKTKLRLARESKGISIMRLSVLSGVSFEKVRQLDTGYRVKTTSYEIKRKIAQALNEKIEVVFPDFKKTMEQRMKEFSKGRKLLAVIKDLPFDLRLTEEAELTYEKTLELMTPEELGDLFHSGMNEESFKEEMAGFIKKYKSA